MQLKEHINILFIISLVYTIWLIIAISRNDLGLRDKFIKSFTIGNDAYIALFMLALTLVYSYYILKTHGYDNLQGDPQRKRLIKALKTGTLAFIIAFFGHLGLWVAPFFFTLVIELI
jgi:hypothetical protein